MVRGQGRLWISMKIADANVVLRYLLNDSEVLSEKAAEILEKQCGFPSE